MEILTKILTLLTFVHLTTCSEWKAGIGYRIGNATDYKLLNTYNKSKLYEVVCSELDDGRPIKLI